MEMTQEWITQYNKKCAEFLFPELVDIDDTGIWGINICLIKNKQTKYEILNNHDSNIFISIELKFHSDWNWIWEIITKIHSIKRDDWMGTYVTIWTPKEGTVIEIKREEVDFYVSIDGDDPKFTTIQAIDQFIDWYNKQEES